jgi:hypothetical protein
MARRKQYRGVKLDSALFSDFKVVKGTSGMFTRDRIILPSATPQYRLQLNHVDNIWRDWSDIKWLIDQVLDGGVYGRAYKWAEEIIKK